MSESKRSSGYYARIMGTFWRHPRTSGLSLAARGLWVSLLSWCADQRSDGEIPAHVVAMISGPDRRASAYRRELENAALLTLPRAGVLQLRNWAKHNITRAEHDREKERARNGMANKRVTAVPIVPPVTRNSGVSSSQPSDQEQEQEQTLPSGRVSDARAHAPAPAVLPDKPPPSAPSAGADLSARAERVRHALTEAYRSRGLVVPARSLSVPHSQEVLDIARSFAEPADLARAIDGFFADARAKTAGFELRWLAARPNQYTGQARDGGRQPRPHAEYRDTPMMSFGELMRGDAAKDGDNG